MLEAIVEIVVTVVEAIVALFIAGVEALAGLLSIAVEALSAGEALGLLASMLLELFAWAVLAIAAVATALFHRRPVEAVARPVFWRPKR